MRVAPLAVKSVALALRKQATSVGLQTHGGKVKQPLLSDRIRDAFPGYWLEMVFPSLVDKKEGQILNQVDGVLFMANSSSSVWAYVLAASVLSWQITHHALPAAIADSDREAAKRAFEALKRMIRISIAAIEAAWRG